MTIAAARKIRRHRNWSALQDSWNEHARAHIDSTLEARHAQEIAR